MRLISYNSGSFAAHFARVDNRYPTNLRVDEVYWPASIGDDVREEAGAYRHSTNGICFDDVVPIDFANFLNS